MATDDRDSRTAYEVYCRECEWSADGPVDLKGTANLLAGRHISRTGHVVALKAVETAPEDAPADDFYRGGGGRSVAVEILRPTDGTARGRRRGPVDYVVESG
ncbi:MAG: hypothetical protein ABEJ92_10085 [Halobacteriales archaeon]